MALPRNPDKGLKQYPDGSWGIDARLHGRRIREKIGNKQQARERYLEIRDRCRRVRHGEPDPVPLDIPTVAKAIEIRMTLAREGRIKGGTARVGRISPSALPGYECNAKLFTALWGTLRLDQLNPALVRAFVSGQIEAGKAASTINRQLSFLSKAVELAIQDFELEDVVRNPVRERLEENNEREEFLTPEQQEVVRPYLKPWQFRALLVAVLTGIRRGDLLAMKRGWIDWERALLRLPQTKDGKRFYLPLAPEVVSVLKEQCDSHPHELVFPSKVGTQILGSNLWRSWAGALKRAGLPHMRWHSLRHTTAQRMIEGGEDLYGVQKYLNHKNPKTTSRYAPYLQENRLRAMAQKLAALAGQGQSKPVRASTRASFQKGKSAIALRLALMDIGEEF